MENSANTQAMNTETKNEIPSEMIKTIQDRVKEMMQDVKVIELYNSFENKQEGEEYIIKAAIATLIRVNKR